VDKAVLHGEPQNRHKDLNLIFDALILFDLQRYREVGYPSSWWVWVARSNWKSALGFDRPLRRPDLIGWSCLRLRLGESANVND
jgi:hypothetical protein